MSADTSAMATLLDRILAVLRGRRSEVEVLVLVQTEHGQVAVPVKRRV
jgi:hypothetical protein